MSFYNEMIFFIQASFLIVVGALISSQSIMWLTGWISLLSVIMNIFVLKQVMLFGLEVTSADVYIIALLSCLNFAREFYSKKQINEAMVGSWIITIVFLILSQLHLTLIPSSQDSSHQHFFALLSPNFRLTLASLVTTIIVQIIDLKLFSYLQSLFNNKAFGLRSTISLTTSQLLDTLLFAFLGLYGIVSNLTHVIIFSFLIKVAIISTSIPIIVFSKWIKTQKDKYLK